MLCETKEGRASDKCCGKQKRSGRIRICVCAASLIFGVCVCVCVCVHVKGSVSNPVNSVQRMLGFMVCRPGTKYVRRVRVGVRVRLGVRL